MPRQQPETDPFIENLFTYHPPTQEQVQIYRELREQTKRLAYTFKRHVPEPELGGCLRGLNIALMSANMAIACASPVEVLEPDVPARQKGQARPDSKKDS